MLHPHADKARIQQSEAAETKSLRRRLKRLQEMGEVTWELKCGACIPEASVEAFVDLENRGWKGDNKSSLRSSAGNERFFREMVAGFGSEGRALFVEMRLDGKIVASTSNFVSGGGGFAFKIAWNPELAKQSPGRLAEVELLRQMFQHEALTGLDFWDSGATEGSYIEGIWPGRRPIVSLGVACSPLARSILGAVHITRAIKRQYRSYQKAAAAARARRAAPAARAAQANGGAKPADAAAAKPADAAAKPARKEIRRRRRSAVASAGASAAARTAATRLGRVARQNAHAEDSRHVARKPDGVFDVARLGLGGAVDEQMRQAVHEGCGRKNQSIERKRRQVVPGVALRACVVPPRHRRLRTGA